MVTTSMKDKFTTEKGFALLMTLIVVGVVLSVGVSMLDLSIKQVRLTSNAKDSEIAFHAANAGVECARYWRRVESVDMEAGSAISPSCFGVGPDGAVDIDNPVAPTISVGAPDGEAYFYSYKFNWGATGQERCTKIDTLTVSSDALAVSPVIRVDNMNALFPGYPDSSSGELDCDPGARCTVISVRGYNKPCGSISSYGVVEREVLVQY